MSRTYEPILTYVDCRKQTGYGVSKTPTGSPNLHQSNVFRPMILTCLSLVSTCDLPESGRFHSELVQTPVSSVKIIPMYTSRTLGYTGLCGGLEHLKIGTRLIDKRFASVMGECVI